MLILSRKPGQSIVIGGIIEITVSEVRGDQVRLGITAPRSVPVFRTEVLIRQDRLSTDSPQPEDLLEMLTRSTDEIASAHKAKQDSSQLTSTGGGGE